MRFDFKKRGSEDKKKRIVPAKLGLLAFLAFCLCVLAWDIAQGGTDGALTAERPAVDVSDLDLPEPAVAVSATAGQEGNEKEDEQAGGESEAAEEEKAGEAPLTTEDAAAAVFAAYRMDREQSRSEELALLQDVIEDKASSEDIRREAEQRRLDIAAAIEQEANADGFERNVPLVVVHGHNDVIPAAQRLGEQTVRRHRAVHTQSLVLRGTDQATVVCAIELDAVKAAQIAEIVSTACEVDFKNVVIVNR